MSTRQAIAAVRATLDALGADVGPWPADARRGEAPSASLGDFVAALAAAAAQADVTLLARDAAALDELVAAGAFPVLVAGGRRRGPYAAVVLVRCEGDEVAGTRVGPDGEPRPFRAPAAGLARHLRAALSPVPPDAAAPNAPPDASPDGAPNAAPNAPPNAAPNGASGGTAPDDPPEPLRVLVPASVAPTLAAAGGPQAARGAYASGGLAGGEAAPGAPADAAPHGPSPVARLWALLVRERRDIGLVFGYATLAGLFSLALPLSVQQVVQLVSGRMLLQPTYLLVGFVVLGTAGVGALQLMQLSVVEAIQQRVFARAALEFGFRVPRLRYDVALREDLPEVMNRFFETVTVQKALSKLLLDLSTALLTVAFGLVLLTFYHPYFSAFGAVLALALALLFRVTGPEGLATSVQESKYKYKVVHWLEEMARANTAFKFAGRSALAVERTDALVTGYLKYRNAHFSVLVRQSVGLIAFRVLVVGALLVLGVLLVTRNQISLGQFVASEIVVVTVLAGVEKLVASLETVYDVLTAVDKLGHVSDLPLEAAGGLALPPGRPQGAAVEVRDLVHRYAPGATPALSGLTLTLRPGERLGVTGYEGSGQTTLLRVLGGLLDGYEGAAAVDGVPLRDLDRPAYRGRVGQLLSPSDLFDGTVEENVAVGRPDLTPHDVLAALDAVGLSGWVRRQPSGMRTPVTNGGRALPSHVVARLLVAQAVVGRPRLVLVDDYHQHVEPDCREDIVRCLTDRARPWTLVLVSHDPAFLAACDRVLVLADGRVAREGPFDRLAEESAFVRRLIDRAVPRPAAAAAAR